jgi:hypothetical protein
MYGEGFDFAPQFAYCLKNVVGSLPVGMDCMSGDMPHWSSTNTATSKEIWVEPVNRFLGAVSVYSSYNRYKTSGNKQKRNLTIKTETLQSEDGNISVNTTLEGSGKHNLEIKVFNAEAAFNKKEINLTGNGPEKIELDLKVTDKSKPYVAVLSVDNDPELQREVVGSSIKPSF